jgi:hypothetical protein
MSEPIKAGDLVVIYRPTTHGCNGGIGAFFKVAQIRPRRSDLIKCSWCGWHGDRRAVGDGNLVADGMPGARGIGTYRLKRIPPLSELEGEKHEEDLREPA